MSHDCPVDHLSGSTASDGPELELQLRSHSPVPVLTLPRVSASDPDDNDCAPFSDSPGALAPQRQCVRGLTQLCDHTADAV